VLILQYKVSFRLLTTDLVVVFVLFIFMIVLLRLCRYRFSVNRDLSYIVVLFDTLCVSFSFLF